MMMMNIAKTLTKSLKRVVALAALSAIGASVFAQAQMTGYPLKAQTLAIQGTEFWADGSGLVLRKGATESSIESIVPVGNGRFDITLHTVNDGRGQSTYEISIGGKSIGSFTQSKGGSDGQEEIHTFKKIEVNEGEALVINVKASSNNGKVFSSGKWTQLVFKPLDGDPGKVVAQTTEQREQEEIEAGPDRAVPPQADGEGSVVISGELKEWHPITLTLDGPFAHEQDINPNPFVDYRMSVTFAHESGVPTYTVPGYFAADGDAGETSADFGTKWRAHLSPDKSGEWSYRVSFVSGEDAAINPAVGEYVEPYQGAYGTFEIAETDKSGDDFRGKGRLEYVGGHYLRHAGSGEYFLKAGPDAPETILAFEDFDNTITMKPNVPIKSWAPHAGDFNAGDPTWKEGKGKNIIGALNYLAEKGVNAFSFLTYNAGGDGDNIWPYVERNGKLHFDCSKLDQWNIVFSHAQNVGLYLHFKLQENELDDNRAGAKRQPKIIKESLDGGLLGTERKLYLREIIARFGHHLALNWNLGEENTQTYEEQRDMAEYILNVDPYDHNIVIHSFPSQQEEVYRRLLGSQSVLTGASLQNSWNAAHRQTLRWVEASRAAGKPWVVANDEQNPAGLGVPPDPGYKGFDGKAGDKGKTYDLHDIRKYTLWGNLMAGGAGVEYYFGYRMLENDLKAEDFRSRDRSWEYCGIALDFFRDNGIPFHRMRNLNPLIGNDNRNNSKYCLAKEGEIYLIYLPNGGSADLDLSKDESKFSVSWFNPREGGKLQKGSTKSVKGGKKVNLGKPPADPSEDWVVLLRK
ncbi:MAG: DUF5060 domain-containing protein [Verrucomicrobiota bacterium]